MIKVILVDSHALFRIGVRAVIEKPHLNIKIVGEAGTGAEFFTILKTTPADIVLLNISLPDINGIEITIRLKEEYPELKILAISAENSTAVMQKMIDIGSIDGYITKHTGNANILIEAICSIMNGAIFFGNDFSDIIYRINASKKKNSKLTFKFTKQEKRIIELCQQGMFAKEIAHYLNIAPRTVEKHKENIFKKNRDQYFHRNDTVFLQE